MSKEIRFTEEIKCLHCNNNAPMKELSNTIIHSESMKIDYGSTFGIRYDLNRNLFWQIIECPACKKHLLREGWYREEVDDCEGPNYRIIYPNEKSKTFHLPSHIQKAFINAQKVKYVGPNAYAVLLGRVLDMVCIDKNATGKSLSHKIKSLAEQGIIPNQILEIALGLKDFRNIGAHADLGELSILEIPIVEELINAILEYIYEAPAIIEKVKLAIQKSKGK